MRSAERRRRQEPELGNREDGCHPSSPLDLPTDELQPINISGAFDFRVGNWTLRISAAGEDCKVSGRTQEDAGGTRAPLAFLFSL
jgi:hypothetical protein